MTEINKLPTLTIFTPTYNRAYILHLCYESLKRQTNKEFIWLIIDDGSTDNTKLLVEKWIKENEVEIFYYYQNNQGMHSAHNTAYELIQTELNMCIDSDDYIPDDAVEKIIRFWRKYGSNKYAGLVGLDAFQNGTIVGTSMPNYLKEVKLLDLYGRYKVKGDKKLVYRTDIIKKVPSYPVFSDEKYCPLSYKYILIDQISPLLIMNEVLCYVEYLEDGSSMNIINQYKNNPKGFTLFRRTAICLSPTLLGKFRECIHYISSSLIQKKYNFVKESPKKLMTFLALPFGLLLYFYIQNTNKKTVFKN